MNKSVQLRCRDIREVFRLLGETCELGADPPAWRMHVIQQLCHQLNARVGFAGELSLPPDPHDTRIACVMECGWADDRQRGLFMEYQRQGGPGQEPMQEPSQRNAHRYLCATRREIVDDRSWYASPIVSEVKRACDTDDQLYSRWPRPKSTWGSMIVLCRSWGERPFAERERRVLHLFHLELGRMWTRARRSEVVLPPRLEQTLALLNAGMSEKQIAAELDLSRHTVHDFLKRLHRQFGVSSRNQLMSRAVGWTRQFAPRLPILPDQETPQYPCSG